MAWLMARFGLNGRQQWALFRIRGKLTLRQFSREPGKLLGVVVAALFILPFVIGLGVATGLGYRRLPQPWPAQLLGVVLTLLWLIWIFFPILFFSLNEGLDIRRLLVYPLRRRDLAASVVLGTLFDYPTYLLLPLFGAILYGWDSGPAVLVVLLALVLAYGHMIMASQLIVATFGGILQSRRFRDISIIVFSLLGSSCYFIQLGFQRFARDSLNYFTEERLLALRPLDQLQWLPTGAAARAIEQAGVGAWRSAFFWLAYEAVLLLVVSWVWGQLLERLITGRGFLIRSSRREAAAAGERRRPAAAIPARHGLAWLPDDIRQLAVKEMKAAWRTPQRRVGLIQSAILPVFFIIPLVATDIMPSQLPAVTGFSLPFYVIFAFWAAGQNMLAWEGRGLPVLLLSPVGRQRIFLAKSAAISLMSLPVLLIVGLLLMITIRSWTPLAGLLHTPAIVAIILAISSVASVLFPTPVNLDKKTRSAFSFGGSCLAALGNTVLVPATIAVLNAPLLGAMGVAYWLNRPWIAFLAVPVGLVYGGLLFWYGTRLAGALLLEREPEVLKAARPSSPG